MSGRRSQPTRLKGRAFHLVYVDISTQGDPISRTRKVAISYARLDSRDAEARRDFV
jgi:hypothetical protein